MMMECQRYQELISRLTDGELNSAEHSALTSHLETCSECKSLYYVFSQLSQLVEEDVGELPYGLHENIMAGVRRSQLKKKNQRRISRQTRSVLAAVACFAVVILAAVGVVSELSMSSNLSSETQAAVYDESGRAAQSDAVSQVKITAADYSAMGSANAALYAQGGNRSLPAAEDDYSGAYDEAQPDATPDPYSGTGGADILPAPVREAPTDAESAAPVQGSLNNSGEPQQPLLSLSDSAAGAPAESNAAVDVGSPQEKTVDIGSMLISALGIAHPDTDSTDAIISQELTVYMSGAESWQSLSALLQGAAQPAELSVLPEETAYKICTLVLSIGVEEHRVYVYEYPDALYYSVPAGLGEAGIYCGHCTVSQFEDFIVQFV